MEVLLGFCIQPIKDAFYYDLDYCHESLDSDTFNVPEGFDRCRGGSGDPPLGYGTSTGEVVRPLLRDISSIRNATEARPEAKGKGRALEARNTM